MGPVFDSLRLSAVTLDIMAVNRGTRADVERRQRSRLARVVAAARAGSRLYAQRLPADPAVPLTDLPTVTKAELMARFDEWVTDPALRLADLQAFVADPGRIAEPWLGRYLVWESSGTSGHPGLFVQDAAAMAVYDALEALRRSAPRPLTRWMDPLYLNERMAFVGATGGHFASYVSLRRLCTLNPWMGAGTRSLDILQPTGALVAALDAFRPTVIAAYPTAATLLADEAAQGRLQTRPREVWTGGECLGPAARRHIEHQLGCTVRNSYGASEFLAMAWECAQGRLHLNADWVILEPVDDAGRAVPAGTWSARALLTHLGQTVQPLIRYELSDEVRLLPQPCACGSPLPVIEVRGRRDEPLHLPGRDGTTRTFLPMALSTVLEDEAGVFEFRLTQQAPATWRLCVPASGPAADAPLARCRAALRHLADLHGAGVWTLEERAGVDMPRGASGKARRISATPAVDAP